jgi:hypothetical protein
MHDMVEIVVDAARRRLRPHDVENLSFAVLSFEHCGSVIACVGLYSDLLSASVGKLHRPDVCVGGHASLPSEPW